MCRRPAFAKSCFAARVSAASFHMPSNDTSINTGCIAGTSASRRTRERQTSCMAKTEKRRTTRTKRLTGDIAKAVRAALDKKAVDVVVLDLRHTPAFTDFFLLCSGQNTRQVQAIADAIEEALHDVKVRPSHVEGYDRAEWILMDF